MAETTYETNLPELPRDPNGKLYKRKLQGPVLGGARPDPGGKIWEKTCRGTEMDFHGSPGKQNGAPTKHQRNRIVVRFSG